MSTWIREISKLRSDLIGRMERANRNKTDCVMLGQNNGSYYYSGQKNAYEIVIEKIDEILNNA